MSASLKALRGDVVAHRARTVAGREIDSEAIPVVVRVVSARKGRAAVHGLLSYIARRGELYADRPDAGLELRNEFGEPVAFEAILRDWPMRADPENLRPAARELVQRGRARDIRRLPEHERYYRRSAYHLVISLQCAPDEDALAAGLLEEVAQDVVWRAFGQDGYHAGWCIHRDIQGRPHAHVVVSAQTDTPGRPERLRLDPVDLDALRHMTWKSLTRLGIRAEWSRREDRQDLREAILEGVEPMREPKLGDRRPMLEAGGIADRAPRWIARHGREAELRWLLTEELARGGLADDASNTARQETPIREVPLDLASRMGLRRAVPQLTHLLSLAGCRMPEEAGLCWAELAREDRRLADWMVLHRPETFGLLHADRQPAEGERLAAALRTISSDVIAQAPPGGLRPEAGAGIVETLRAARDLRLRAGRAARMLRSLSGLEDEARSILGEGRTVEMVAETVAGLRRASAITVPASNFPTSQADHGRGRGSWRRRFVRDREGDAR